MVILLNKAHYWVLKQHTDSTPQLTISSKPYRWTVIHVISWSPRSRGNPINYTSVSFVMQIRFPWFTPQSFLPKILQHHQQSNPDFLQARNQNTIQLKVIQPLLTRRNTEEVLRFLLLAAATHTTIQTPKHPCNLKKGEVDHKHGGLGPSWPKHDTRTPSQERISSSKVLRKKFKNLQKNPKNLQNTLSEHPNRTDSAHQTTRQRRPTREAYNGGTLGQQRYRTTYI